MSVKRPLQTAFDVADERHVGPMPNSVVAGDNSAEGRPITVQDPGTDHGRRLVAALGAEIRRLAICTRDIGCTADVDGHEADCPVEARLREEFGY